MVTITIKIDNNVNNNKQVFLQQWFLENTWLNGQMFSIKRAKPSIANPSRKSSHNIL